MTTGKRMFLVILALVLVGGGAYLYRTPKPRVVVESVSMQTYMNSEFGFSVRYPARFASTQIVASTKEREEFYKTVAELSSKNQETIKVSVINNVDIYKNEDVVKVATREVMDSGYKYTVSPTTINSYSAAITSKDEVVTKDNISSKTTTITIKHPKLNIYVVLDVPSRISKVEFEEILSSFKFTENSDPMLVNDLVNNFYTALESQDGKILFNYFTPPTTSQEKTDFNWLTGADLAGAPIYRAFLRLKISDPKITATQMVNDTTFVVKITDQLLVSQSAGSEKTVFSPRSRNVVLIVIKVDDKWLVDKFTDPSKTTTLNTSTTKYSGFGQ